MENKKIVVFNEVNMSETGMGDASINRFEYGGGCPDTTGQLCGYKCW